MYATGGYHDVHYNDDRNPSHERSLRYLLENASLPKAPSLLDFGCGTGGFLRAARRHGMQVAGIEHSADTAREIARRTSLDVDVLAARLEARQRFDVVHLGDVLEHLPEPAAVFGQLAQLVAPGGCFFVEGPLQANPSLVYFAAAAFRTLRRRVRADRPGTTPPTHLLLATERSQREFFSRRLGYREVAFELTEDGWPYLHRGPRSTSLGDRVRGTIGHAAVALAAAPGFRGTIGNRFRTVVVPPSA